MHRIEPPAISIVGTDSGTILGYPNVYSLHTTNGRWDIVAEIRADTLESFDLVLNAIRRIQGIATTETSILLSTHKV
jgi:DNA-binding Lrp family transcriptional regulator